MINIYQIKFNNEHLAYFESNSTDDYSILNEFFKKNKIEIEYFDKGKDGAIIAYTWQGGYTIE